MNVVSKVTVAVWLFVLGYLGLYTWGLVMGVFSPGELAGFTVAAVILATLFAIHAVRMRHAMRDHDHDELMRGVHRYRERRGF